MESLIDAGLLPAGTLVPTEASLVSDRGGLPIGPVLRDALLERLCGVSGLGSATALAAVLHAAHPPCTLAACRFMLGGRPEGEAAFGRLCKAALRLLQTMPDTSATRELLARPLGSLQSEEQRRPLTDAATAWEAEEEGLHAAVGKLLAPLLRVRAESELFSTVGAAVQSLINVDLLPPGTLVPTEASLTVRRSGGLPIGPVLRDALLERLCGVSGLGSANGRGVPYHAESTLSSAQVLKIGASCTWSTWSAVISLTSRAGG